MCFSVAIYYKAGIGTNKLGGRVYTVSENTSPSIICDLQHLIQSRVAKSRRAEAPDTVHSHGQTCPSKVWVATPPSEESTLLVMG